MEPRFIVVEGPDGAGKSEIVQRVAESLDFTPYKTPPEEYRRIRDYFDLPTTDPMSRFFFYTAGICDASRDISLMLKSTGVVSDRYTHSLLIYHELLTRKNLRGIIDNLDIIKPDVTIILNAEPSVLEGRIRERRPTSDRELERRSDFMLAVNRKFSSIRGRDVVHIDTSHTSIEGAHQKCLNNLLRLV
ncbi:MAG: hypothetical protein AABW46_04540 [Nanoarchaeota archaeon]